MIVCNHMLGTTVFNRQLFPLNQIGYMKQPYIEVPRPFACACSPIFLLFHRASIISIHHIRLKQETLRLDETL